MPDTYSSSSLPRTPRRGPSIKAVLGTSLFAFLGGAALVGYLVWDGEIKLDANGSADRSPVAVLAQPGTASEPAVAASSPSAAVALPSGGLDLRIATLEQRLARIDLQASAAEGNTARAEALLVAFAARRALEKGAPLGYLADQLKMRFGNAQPNAVQTVIETADQPVTLDQLSGQLDAMATVLTAIPHDESGLAKLKRELSTLFVVRHDDRPSSRPEERLQRAQMLLRTGQIDAAVAEVSRMPGNAAANDWVSSARRYAGAERALDLIETTALLDADKLKTASGRSVRQSSPAGPSAVNTQVPETTY